MTLSSKVILWRIGDSRCDVDVSIGDYCRIWHLE